MLDHNHAKNITTKEFNKLTAENFTTRLKPANLATKADIDDFVEKKLNLNKKKLLQRNQSMYWLKLN